ncbi:MAG: DUF1549 domain-containing protein, partial [Dongiaceae bacterium]
VLPLLRTLGCSGRNCHGSASGQGGFRLSLFGYDFKIDHQTLLEGENPRVDIAHPESSLILLKPTLQIDHGGGERFTKDGWKYELIRKWIEGGAMPVDPEDPQFEDLQMMPAEISETTPGQTHAVRVICEWSDQRREDVTPLCYYDVLDDSVASVDEQGIVTILGPGDTHLIAFYDNGIVSIPITIPFAAVTDAEYPKEDSPTVIDRLISQKLKKLGMVPSELCTDAEFLRRVSLDIAGSLPQPGDVQAFLSDTSHEKRTRKIDDLLATPGYASYWAFKLSELWGNKALDLREQFARPSQMYHWYRWTEDRLERNVPYDQIVEWIEQSRVGFGVAAAGAGDGPDGLCLRDRPAADLANVALLRRRDPHTAGARCRSDALGRRPARGGTQRRAALRRCFLPGDVLFHDRLSYGNLFCASLFC